jgi:hypothetical protein
MLTCDIENKEEIDNVMSNFDHEINYEIAEQLKTTNTFAGYPAWDFFGYVWYENNQYHCEINRYCVHIDTISADKIEEIMEIASEKYGYK